MHFLIFLKGFQKDRVLKIMLNIKTDVYSLSPKAYFWGGSLGGE